MFLQQFIVYQKETKCDLVYGSVKIAISTFVASLNRQQHYFNIQWQFFVKDSSVVSTTVKISPDNSTTGSVQHLTTFAELHINSINSTVAEVAHSLPLRRSPHSSQRFKHSSGSTEARKVAARMQRHFNVMKSIQNAPYGLQISFMSEKVLQPHYLFEKGL